MSSMIKKEKLHCFNKKFIEALEEHFMCSIEELTDEVELGRFQYEGKVYDQKIGRMDLVFRVKSASACTCPNLEIFVADRAAYSNFEKINLKRFGVLESCYVKKLHCERNGYIHGGSIGAYTGENLNVFISDHHTLIDLLNVIDFDCFESNFVIKDIDLESYVFDEIFGEYEEDRTNLLIQRFLSFDTDSEVLYHGDNQIIIRVKRNNITIKL